MKKQMKTLTVALLVLAAGTHVMAENRIAVETQSSSILVGSSSNRAALTLKNSEEIKAIQLRIFANSAEVSLKEVRPGSRSSGSGWTVQYNAVDETHMNVVIMNLGTDMFQAGDGSVAEIVFDVSESFSESSFSFSLEGVKAADPRGAPVTIQFDSQASLAVNSGVNARFVINPQAVSLVISNRSEISTLRFEAKLEGATSISQPVLRGRAAGMQMRFEQSAGSIVLVLENSTGGSIEPGNDEILEIAVQTSSALRLVVHDLSLTGSDHSQLESQISIVEPVEKPQEFVLLQNYPNPFNPATTISYELRTPTEVTLKIYNTAGQEVATLAQGLQQAGSYSMVWNGTNDHGTAVSSGTYIYRLAAGETSTTKKMVLLK